MIIQKGRTENLGRATITIRNQSLTPRGREKRHKQTRVKQTNDQKHTDQLSRPQSRWSQCKKDKKHKDKTQSNTKYKSPRRFNHKATESNINTGTNALERSLV